MTPWVIDLEANGLYDTVTKLIERYKEPMKTGLYLHLLEGVALRTVTEIVGVPFTTVRFHANKVREALK